MLNVLELFGGIGAPRKALENLKVDIKTIDYVEILPYAVEAYNQIFESKYKPQDIRTWNLNVDILIHGSPCLLEGTLITTKNGLKKIEEIEIGEKVLTHQGNYKKVLNTFYQGVKDIYQLKTHKGNTLYLTNNHKVFTNEGWVEVKDLTTNHYIKQPKLGYKLDDVSVKQDMLSIRNNKNYYYDNNNDLWLRVKSIINTNTKGKVYDIEVQDDHSMVANGLAVHNCQDFSIAGKNDMSTGRSILYQRTLEIIEKELIPRPKVIIWENVKGLTNKNNIHHLEHYLQTLESFGYKNTYKVLNSLDFGIPQNRERVFVVSIRNDIDFNFDFDILERKELQPLVNFLQKEPIIESCEYDINQPSMVKTLEDGKVRLSLTYNATITTKQVRWNNAGVIFKDYTNFYISPRSSDGKLINGAYNRIWKLDKYVGTIPVANIPKIGELKDKHLMFRNLTPRECWRLMGFTDDDFDKVLMRKIPKDKLYLLAGNSIVVPVLEAIFKPILKFVFKKGDK